jgi:hypothetical protein
MTNLAGNAARPLELRPGTTARDIRVRWFFFAAATILAVVVAVGFAPSFYLRGLRPAHRAPGLPGYLIAHGVALSAWYLLFVVQTWLIATRHTRLHRTLGIAGVVLAALVFALSMTVVLRAPARDIAAGASVAEISLMVIGDLGILMLFAVFVTLGTRYRRRRDIHGRLMTLAAVSIVAPAIARWPGAEAAMPLSVIVPQLSFCAALIAYDLTTRRRVHRATGWGVASYLLVIGVTVPLALSELGHRLVNALR